MIDDDVAALEGLAATAPAIDAATGEVAPQAAPPPQETAQATAALIAYMTEEVIRAVWPVVQYTDEQRQMFQVRLMPVLVKHDGGLPPMLAEWAAELHLIAFLGLTGFTTWRQVAAHNEQAKLRAGYEAMPTAGKLDGQESTPRPSEPARPVFGTFGRRQESGPKTNPDDPAA